jgi:hypothetical protein
LIRLRATIRPSIRHVNAMYPRPPPINGRVILNRNASHDLPIIIRFLQTIRLLRVFQTVHLSALTGRAFALRKRTLTVSPRYVQFPGRLTAFGWIERTLAWYRGGRGGGGGGGGVVISNVMIWEQDEQLPREAKSLQAANVRLRAATPQADSNQLF